MRRFSELEEENLKTLTQLRIEATLVQITATGFQKSILDATEPMRHYFKEHGVHDFDLQPQGPEHKKLMPTTLYGEEDCSNTVTSFYRPITKKGDPRIWPRNVTKYSNPDDILAIIFHDDKLHIFNLSRTNLSDLLDYDRDAPLAVELTACHKEVSQTSDELLNLLREMATSWHRTDVLADTGVGRAIEHLLGIDKNCSPLPDYKGIELKSYREKRNGVRSSLFSQVPDWSISKMKSAKEIVDTYGYWKHGSKTYHNTLSCKKINSQGLGLSLYQTEQLLTIEEKTQQAEKVIRLNDVAAWRLDTLHKRLQQKHHETFWIEVETTIRQGLEYFRPVYVEHTKNPILSQFDTLLDAGYITVDLLLSRSGGHGDTVSFKIKKSAKGMLFPKSKIIHL